MGDPLADYQQGFEDYFNMGVSKDNQSDEYYQGWWDAFVENQDNGE